MGIAQLIRCVATIVFFWLFAGTCFAQSDSLVLISPSGGEILYTNRDTVVSIRWGGVADTVPVRIEYTTDLIRFTVIADSVRGLEYAWNISGLPVSSTYRVRVVQARPPIGSDNIVYTGHNGAVTEGCWDPTSNRVVTVSATADVWDTEVGGSTPLLVLNPVRSNYIDVAWSPDSSLVWMAGSGSNSLSVFTMNNNANVWSYDCSCMQSELVMGRSGMRVALGGLRSVYVFDYPSQVPVKQTLSSTDILDIGMDSTESKLLVCADQASVYQIGGGLPVVFREHFGGVLAGAFHPSGSQVATIGGDAKIYMWDATTAITIWSAQDQSEGVRSLAFSADGQYLAVGMSDSSVTIWNSADGVLFAKLTKTSGAVRQVEWSPKAHMLVTAGDDNVAHVFDVDKRRSVYALSHQNKVTSAHWSKDGASILTTSLDGTARTWRIGEIILQADTSGSFSYAPPPPAFARFRTTGDTAAIGDELTLQVVMEASADLALSDIDSVQFRLSYDASMLYTLESSVPTIAARDSALYRIVTLAPVTLPRTNGTLATIRYRATLGADSTTRLRIDNVTQIGRGPGIRVETVTDSVLLTGICRAGNTPRLYSPVGLPLEARIQSNGGEPQLVVTFAEIGPVTISAYTLQGERCWSTSFTRWSVTDEPFRKNLFEIGGGALFVVVTTATQTCTVMAESIR